MPSPTSTESDIETTFNEDPILKDAVGEGELDAKHDETATNGEKDKHSDYTATALEITSDTNGDNISTIDEESNGLNLPGEHNDEDDNSRASTTNLFKPEPSKTTTHINSESSSLTKRNIKQYEYIKHGSRIKTLLSTAFRAVADGWLGDEDGERQRKKREAEDDGKKEEEAMSKKARGFKEAEELARDKMEECVILNGKIQDLQCQITALQQENYSSHQTSAQLQSKVDRTLAALQIACQSSANARAEADVAEAKAESLSRQMEDIQNCIEELRRGMDAVRSEHDEVSAAARSVESRLIQAESELKRATKVKIEAEEERDELKSRAEEAERKAHALAEKNEDCENEIRCLKKDVVEMEELEKIRSQRTDRVENELHVARGTLLDATSAAAEAESTVTSLHSVIEELRKENELLHNQIEDSRDSVRKERAKQNEALLAVEKDAQKWKMKLEEEQEANRALKMDKTSAEKQVEQMKCRIANLERRFDDAGGDSTSLGTSNVTSSTAVTPVTSSLGLISSFGDKVDTVDSEYRKKLTYVTKLPMRESSKTSKFDDASRELHYSSSTSKYFSSEKENSSNTSSNVQKSSLNTSSFTKRKVAKSTKCCICEMPAMGMMKNCQCDKINCDKRAHMTCITRRNTERGVSSSAVLCE